MKAPDLERSCICFIDPVEGALLRVEITDESVPDDSPAEPDAAAYMRQLREGGEESWGSVPNRFPPVTLLSALETVESEMGGVREAKRIVVHLVDWRMGPRRRHSDESGGFVNDWRVAWCIDLRGIPPFDAAFPGVPVEARNHLRHVVDATSGRWLVASTVPQPERTDPAAQPQSTRIESQDGR